MFSVKVGFGMEYMVLLVVQGSERKESGVESLLP